MESLSKHLLSHPEFNDRVFVSNPPSAALLIWSSNINLPNITGIAIVEMGNTEETNLIGINTKVLLEILNGQNKENIPVLHIVYSNDMSNMLINGKSLTLIESAELISRSFNVQIGNNPAKVPNDENQISDPFHLWSRDAFDGFTVIKTDIDIVTINENKTKLKSIIEVKRSAKIPVGCWLPFINPNYANNDTNNFFLLFSFAKLFEVNLFTVHHDLMNEMENMTEDQLIDVFILKHKDIKEINQASLNLYGSINNRTTIKIKDFLGN